MHQGNDYARNSQYSYIYPHSYPSPTDFSHSDPFLPSSADISAPYPQISDAVHNPPPVSYHHLLPHSSYDPQHPSASYTGYSDFTSSYPSIDSSYIRAEVDCQGYPRLDKGFCAKQLEDEFICNDNGEGVYAYGGSNIEPYGSLGNGTMRSSSSSSWTGFDDYGRSVDFSSFRREQAGGLEKAVRAEPKAETEHDVRTGVQKFRVKLLPESAGQSTVDVLCQVGLDGIHMLDPSSNRTLRIYPLENLIRWEEMDSFVFAFWAKSSVDIEPRRIRLQSNCYTIKTMLDIVTAAIAQLKEIGGTSEASKQSGLSIENKKGFGDWISLIKPLYEEKDHWVPDEAVGKCTSCVVSFGAFVRRHHCRNCGDIFCDKCSQGRIALTADKHAQPVRVCDRCTEQVTRRLNIAKESTGISSGIHSHEILARKLQEEMDKNRRTVADVKSLADGFSKQTKEVACPTCTVILQVQVPTSGSGRIECGVCRHPFLVSADRSA